METKLHCLRAIRDEDHGLLGGHDRELYELHRKRLTLFGPSGWWLSDAGKEILAAAEAIPPE